MTRTWILTTLTSKSARKPLLSLKRQRGFTLIEILIVVALMAMIFAAAIPGIGGAIRATIENSTRELATTIRAAYDESILKGRVYRLAFDIDKSQYWVEQGPTNFLLMTDEQKEDRAKRDARLTKEELEAKPKVVFSIATGVTNDKKNLPGGVSFSDIIGSLSKEPIKGGIVYAHIFPHGFIEKVTIHLKDKNEHESTIIVDPISGKSKVYNSYIKDSKK